MLQNQVVRARIRPRLWLRPSTWALILFMSGMLVLLMKSIGEKDFEVSIAIWILFGWGVLVLGLVCLAGYLVWMKKVTDFEARHAAAVEAAGPQQGEPGWFPDPFGSAPLRFFNGVRWTEETADTESPPDAP